MKLEFYPEYILPIQKLLQTIPTTFDLHNLALRFPQLASCYGSTGDNGLFGIVFEYWLSYLLRSNILSYGFTFPSIDPDLWICCREFPVIRKSGTTGFQIYKNGMSFCEVDSILHSYRDDFVRHVFILEAKFCNPRRINKFGTVSYSSKKYKSIFSISRMEQIIQLLRLRWQDATYSYGVFLPTDAIRSDSLLQQAFLAHGGLILPSYCTHEQFVHDLFYEIYPLCP